MSDPRNPVFIPESEPQRRRGCPKCGHADFDGTSIQGSVRFTCANMKCRHQWSGGLPHVPVTPGEPVLPVDPRSRPTVSFEPYVDKNTKRVEYREETRRPDLTQSFRRGAPVPEGEDY